MPSKWERRASCSESGKCTSPLGADSFLSVSESAWGLRLSWPVSPSPLLQHCCVYLALVDESHTGLRALH